MNGFNEIDYWIKNINENIYRNIKSSNSFLNTLLRDHVIGGGKRIRGLFLVGSASMGKFDEKKVLKAATMIEILHAATLVHDDVVDKAEKRRGKDTINAAYSADLAVYAGDFLFTKAVFLASGLLEEKHMENLAKAIKSVCEGEVIQYKEKFNVNLSELQYFRIISRKTALLFAMSCVLGAAVGELPEKQQKQMAKFGYNYGMAFQIADDLKDLLSEEEVEGKPVFSDIKAGTMTLPLIFGVKSSLKVRELLSQNNGKPFEQRDNDFCKRVRMEVLKTDAVDKTTEVIKKYKTRMENILRDLPDGSKKDIFTHFISLNLNI